jgi:hypothetical protein
MFVDDILFFFFNKQPVCLAGGWLLVLIYSKRKVLLM